MGQDGEMERMENELFPDALEILYRDEHVIAVNKPAGLLVHRAPQTPRDQPVLLQKLRDQIGQMLYPAHRLDRPTSGIVVFGLHSMAAAGLVQEFTQRRVTKGYEALVRGYVPERMQIDVPLRDRFGEEEPGYDLACHPLQAASTEVWSRRWFEVPWANAQHATTRYALVEAKPRTGRWHQIRRHLKHVSHPIIGDYRHGDAMHNQWFAERLGSRRMLLVASGLELKHPMEDRRLVLRAGRGAEFDRVLAWLGAYEREFDPSQVPPEPAYLKTEEGD